MSNIGFALQLDAVHLGGEDSLAGHFDRIREQGFDYFVWKGASCPRPEVLQEAQQRSRTRIVAAQVPWNTLLTDGPASAEYWALLGVPDLLVDDAPAALDADHLESLASLALPGKLRVSLVFPPVQSMELLRAADLQVSVDTGRVSLAGTNPADPIRAAFDCSPLVLLHDLRQSESGEAAEFVPLGQGNLDWREILDAGEEAAAEWYVAGCLSANFLDPLSLREACTFLKRNA